MTAPANPSVAGEPAGHFQATRWSIVLAVRQEKSPDSEAALAWLCERYWRPLHTWARAKGLAPADAEDLVQGFFEQALAGGLMAQADASRGRFRSFLLGCLAHYWTDQRRRQGAEKRGGGTTTVSLASTGIDDPIIPGIGSTRSPEHEYDRAWACAVLDSVTARLEAECDADRHAGRFAILRIFLDGDRGEMPLQTAADQLGLSLSALKSTVHRLRRRMREMIREEIRETVQTDAEVEVELQELFRALRS